MIANVYSVPRPLAGRQPRLPAKQCGHRSRTGKLQPPQSAQCCSISLPSRAPSKNVALTVSGMGTGLPVVWDIVSSFTIATMLPAQRGLGTQPGVASEVKAGLGCGQHE